MATPNYAGNTQATASRGWFSSLFGATPPIYAAGKATAPGTPIATNAPISASSPAMAAPNASSLALAQLGANLPQQLAVVPLVIVDENGIAREVLALVVRPCGL